MTGQTLRALRKRIGECRQRLAERLESEADAGEIEALQKRVDLLEKTLGRVRRRRSLAWSGAAVAFALLVMVVFGYALHLRRTTIVLTADTGAFTFTNGAKQVLLNPGMIEATEIASTQPPLRRGWCVQQHPERHVPCELVKSLRLNALVANPQAVATVRLSDSCTEVVVVRGVIEASVSAFAVADTAPQPIPKVAALRLTPGHEIRLCGSRQAVLQLVGATSITVGDQTRAGAAEEESYPAVLKGTLALVDVGETIPLQRTDIPRLRGLEKCAVIARLKSPIELTVLASGSGMTMDRDSTNSLMPSWLDWLRHNPGVQGLLATIGAIVAAVWALRERFLGESG